MTREHVDDLLVWVTLGVILGGRLGYVLFYRPGYYLGNPLDALAVWHGGMSFHGGLVGVLLAGWIFSRRNGLDPLRVGDAQRSEAQKSELQSPLRNAYSVF